MLTHSRQIYNLDELRKFVNNTLCQQEQLEADSFPMSERLLVRKDQPCGMFFCLHGPRSVKVTAIWETDRNQLLFYDSTGQRFLRTQLLTAPTLAAAC